MALMKCADCGSDVSSEAVTCFKCGRPTPRTRSEEQRKKRGANIVALLFFGVCIWVSVAVYRAWTGADIAGTECTLRVSKKLDSKANVPLFPTSDEARQAYGAILLGIAKESDFEHAKWFPPGTMATIRGRDGAAFRVDVPSFTGWVAEDLCQR